MTSASANSDVDFICSDMDQRRNVGIFVERGLYPARYALVAALLSLRLKDYSPFLSDPVEPIPSS